MIEAIVWRAELGHQALHFQTLASKPVSEE